MLEQKRQALFAAAAAYALNSTSGEAQRALCLAASEYHQARMDAASGVTAAKMKAAAEDDRGHGDMVMPFGRSKGKPIRAVPKADLEWMLGAVERSIEDPEKERFLEANQALRDVLRTELGRRG